LAQGQCWFTRSAAHQLIALLCPHITTAREHPRRAECSVTLGPPTMFGAAVRLQVSVDDKFEQEDRARTARHVGQINDLFRRCISPPRSSGRFRQLHPPSSISENLDTTLGIVHAPAEHGSPLALAARDLDDRPGRSLMVKRPLSLSSTFTTVPLWVPPYARARVCQHICPLSLCDGFLRA
jgi:hypothetical protein